MTREADIEAMARAICDVIWPLQDWDGERRVADNASMQAAEAAYAIVSKRIEELEGDWFDKAIRDHCAEHGPSGGAWNISMVLERLHRARSTLSDKGTASDVR